MRTRHPRNICNKLYIHESCGKYKYKRYDKNPPTKQTEMYIIDSNIVSSGLKIDTLIDI